MGSALFQSTFINIYPVYILNKVDLQSVRMNYEHLIKYLCIKDTRSTKNWWRRLRRWGRPDLKGNKLNKIVKQ